jgi:hypothetical protein
MPTIKGENVDAILDAHSMSENERIDLIGNRCLLSMGREFKFLVDDDTEEPGKADRYVAKLKQRFPSIVEVRRGPFTKGATIVVVKVP